MLCFLMWPTAPSCHCQAKAAWQPQHPGTPSRECGHSQGKKSCTRSLSLWRGRIFLLLCSLFSVFSFYCFHSSPNLFLPFPSSSLVDHQPTHGSYQSHWVWPLTLEAPNTNPSCALSQARIISSPSRLLPHLCTAFSPTAFPSPFPSHPAV